MAKTIQHRGVNIVSLAAEESIAEYCKARDIAILTESTGWSVHFIGQNGSIDSYDQPYPSYNAALWACKAAAEFGVD
jgi:N-acyl-L-homoserine lactone synthetase